MRGTVDCTWRPLFLLGTVVVLVVLVLAQTRMALLYLWVVHIQVVDPLLVQRMPLGRRGTLRKMVVHGTMQLFLPRVGSNPVDLVVVPIRMPVVVRSVVVVVVVSVAAVAAVVVVVVVFA